jgi:colanic acid/amylovoran biosynthesis glycosyltransferase
MGCLCIVSDAEGLNENILDKVTGFVFEKRNPELLAKKIIEVIRISEIRRNEIILNAINRVRIQFDLKNQKNQFLEFYLNHG